MAFIKGKKIKGRQYYYVVESYRENGKVKTRTLKYLGEKPEAPEELRGLMGRPRRRGVRQRRFDRDCDVDALAAAAARIILRGPMSKG